MWQPFLLEARYELTKLARLRVFAFMTLGFPLMFYLLFGVALAGSRATGGQNLATYMLGTYGAFGVIGAALFSFGVSIAVERAQGWLLLKRATAMPPLVYVMGKVGATMVFCALVVVCMGVAGAFLGGVRLSGVQWLSLTLALVVGSIPFCALGLMLGFICGPNSAPGIVNVVHLLGAFSSGLWVPLNLLPRAFGAIGPWLPQYHLAQLALAAIGQSPSAHPVQNVVGLAVWTIIAVFGATAAYRRDEGQLYG